MGGCLATILRAYLCIHGSSLGIRMMKTYFAGRLLKRRRRHRRFQFSVLDICWRDCEGLGQVTHY
mgnify:CR=1 FL=1